MTRVNPEVDAPALRTQSARRKVRRPERWIEDMSEKRRFPRVEMNSTVLIAAPRGGYLAEVHDVSLGGARVSRPLEWVHTLSEPFRLFFIFDQDTVIELTADLIRQADTDLAFLFHAGQDDEAGRLMYETRFAASL